MISSYFRNFVLSVCSNVRICLIISILFLSSCEKPPWGGSICVDASDYGMYEERQVSVSANKEFTASGMDVAANNPIQIDINGTVSLCNNQAIYGPDVIDPKINRWQQAITNGQPFSVKKNDNVKIFVTGQFRDKDTVHRDGKGLYVLIAPEGVDVNAADSEDDPGHQFWYGTRYGDESNRLAGSDNLPTFFELYDNGSDVGESVSGYSFKAPIDGITYFKYARSASVRGINSEGGPQPLGAEDQGLVRQSPWLGEYAWHNSCWACTDEAINGICAGIAAVSWFIGGYKTVFPLCIGAYNLGCAASGDLQETYTAETRPVASSDGKNCREHDASEGGGDHWIDNAYDGTDGDGYIGFDPNGLGYNITMEGGCEGVHGKFLQMYISNDIQRQYIAVNNPPGCEIGVDDGCEVLKDSNGTDVYEIVSTVNVTNPINLDMRREVNDPANPGQNHQPNPGYYAPGKYGERDPDKAVTELTNTGELWFRINDNITSIDGVTGNYKDNTGSYSLSIKTLKVGSVSKAIKNIIGYIKGIVHGYCRIAINDFGTNGEDLPVSPNSNEFIPIDYTSIDYNLTEEQCNSGGAQGNGFTYKLFNGDTAPAWQPGITKRVFGQLVGGTTWNQNGEPTNNTFLSAVRASMILFVAVYGFLYSFGLVFDKKHDVIKKCLKIGVIFILFSPDSWEILNKFFFTIFIDGLDDLIQAIAGQISGASPVLTFNINGELIENSNVDNTTIVSREIDHFVFIDNTIQTFFNSKIWIKMAALLFANNYGWLLFFLIFFHMIYFLFIVCRAVIIYLMAIISLSLLIIVAPIFISLLLFEKTKDFFDSWIRSLLSFLFQPIFVLFALGIFNLFIFNAFYQMMYYDVCWINRWQTNIHSLINHLLTPIHFYTPVTEPGSNTRLLDPIKFNQAILFFVFVIAASAFVEKMSKIASYIFLGTSTTSIDSVVAKKLINETGSGAVSIAKFTTKGAYSLGKGAVNKASGSYGGRSNTGKTSSGKTSRG